MISQHIKEHEILGINGELAQIEADQLDLDVRVQAFESHSADSDIHVTPAWKLAMEAKSAIYYRATIAERDAITGMKEGDICRVKDAGDGKFASYCWSSTSWDILSDADWENLNLSWNSIIDKPDIPSFSGYSFTDRTTDPSSPLAGQITLFFKGAVAYIKNAAGTVMALASAVIPTGVNNNILLSDGAGGVKDSGKAIDNASGNVPLSNGTVNTNLNADQVDGKNVNANAEATYDTIPLYGTGGVLPVGAPTGDTHAVTKAYADALIAGAVSKGLVPWIGQDVTAVKNRQNINGIDLHSIKSEGRYVGENCINRPAGTTWCYYDFEVRNGGLWTRITAHEIGDGSKAEWIKWKHDVGGGVGVWTDWTQTRDVAGKWLLGCNQADSAAGLQPIIATSANGYNNFAGMASADGLLNAWYWVHGGDYVPNSVPIRETLYIHKTIWIGNDPAYCKFLAFSAVDSRSWVDTKNNGNHSGWKQLTDEYGRAVDSAKLGGVAAASYALKTDTVADSAKLGGVAYASLFDASGKAISAVSATNAVHQIGPTGFIAIGSTGVAGASAFATAFGTGVWTVSVHGTFVMNSALYAASKAYSDGTYIYITGTLLSSGDTYTKKMSGDSTAWKYNLTF